MKILAVYQHYSPEPFRISDICEELVRRGHEVTMLTGVPNYPMGKVYPGYEKSADTEEIVNGVRVIHCKTVPRGNDIFHRFLNYFSYPIFAGQKAVKLKDDYDVVFANQTSPVMMAWPAIKYAKKHRKKTVMYCLDLWPASLSAGGISAKRPIYKIFGWLSGYIYRRMDIILISSKMFESYLIDNFSIDNDKIQYLPQYSESIFDEVGTEKDGFTDIMFAGNIGKAQSLDTVIKAAKEVKNRNIRWHIVGDGLELERVRKMAAGMDNVIFYGRRPLSEMPLYYKKADAMLVTLINDQFVCLTLPGKVQTYMAAGKPIISAADGETKRTVEEAGCGFAVGSEDWKGLARAAEAFAGSTEKETMGRKAREYCEANYKKGQFFDRLEKILKEQTI